jgi:hypothetical protein
MKYTLEATIPTTQYGNIRPKFELENEGDVEDAYESLKSLWDRFGETPLKDKHQGGVVIETFTGEQVIFNEKTHTYTDLQGNILISGSQYANEKSPKFDLELLLPKTAKAWGINEVELRKVWELNAEVSNFWGSAVHTALELYHNHHDLGSVVQDTKELEQNYVLPKNPILREMVLDFVEKFGVNAQTEVVVSDVANRMVGTIDRLEIIDEVTFRVGDYKTNNEMDKKKALKYQKQMSFYAHTLQNKGYTVQGLDLFYYNHKEGWQKTELELLPLE